MTTDLTTTLPPERTDATALEFIDVTKTFADGTHALASTSLTVKPGEFVSIVGPSGCGKSTLLRIASGLDAPTTGTVSVDRRNLGYVFQDPTLLQWRTVRRNVELFAELEGIDRVERARRIADNVRLVGLEGFEDKYPKQLSGGMKMRASLARSLLMEPAMFLFDEPFGALDEITRERLNDELLALFQRKRFGALFITHSISEAVFLSTRVLVMSARPGRLIGEFAVPFGYPRSPDLRFEPAFAELCGELSRALRGARMTVDTRPTVDAPVPTSAPVPGALPNAPQDGLRWIDIVGPLVGFVLFIGLWWLMHAWGMRALFDKPSFLLPSPATVVDRSYLDATVRGDMLQALWWTAGVALTGLAISIGLGMVIAVIMAQANWVERSVWPYLIAAQAVPILAIAPLIGNIFGFGFGSRVLVCVIISIFPIVSNTLFGLLSADPSRRDLFTLKRASRWVRLTKLQLPSALPAIFTGFRIAAGLSVIGAVVGELFFRKGGKGIGILMEQYRSRTLWPQTYGALILSSVLGILVFVFFGWLSRLAIGRWHETTR